jgi:glyoxylase-like metal-dependent hydrolase (beta-lactamase superfamily II)
VTDLAAYGVAHVRAENPGPLTLSGTNTWIVGRDPAWIVDPGPALDDHLDAVAAETVARGGAGGIVLTHDHHDHSEGVEPLRERLGGVPTGDPGPLEVMPLPGHASDHVVYFHGRVAFTGDAVLGEGSVFVAGEPGAMARYLEGLRVLRERELAVICPGHGPPVWEPRRRLDEYLSHRLDRERRLVEALAAGVRGEDALLDAVWDDAPAVLRPAAAVTLRAHLWKLEEEGRLPPGAAPEDT